MSSAETPYHQQSAIADKSTNKAAAATVNLILSPLIDCDAQDESRLKLLNNRIQSQSQYPQQLLNLISDRITMATSSSGNNTSSLSHPCAYNCSGHGDCYDGTCFCQVRTLLSFQAMTNPCLPSIRWNTAAVLVTILIYRFTSHSPPSFT